jgi:hypothetical protein
LAPHVRGVPVGEFCFATDTNEILVSDGTAWLPIGPQQTGP